MKRLFFILVAYLVANTTQAQILKNAANRVKQRLEQKTNQKIDEAVDEAVDGKKGTNNETNNSEPSNVSNQESSPVKGTSEKQTIKTYSKYDFVPGDKILYAEDFGQDVIGEFPVKWNTNGNGEVVSIEGLTGKWLQLQENTDYTAPFKGKLPENYTVEYDLVLDFKDDQSVPNIRTQLLSDILPGHAMGGQIEFTLTPNGGTSENRDAAYYRSYTGGGDNHLTGKTQYYSAFNNANHKRMPVHVAIWVQKERFRAWVNQDKIYDLPKGIASDVATNQLKFETSGYGGPKENYKYFLSNIKIAVATPDNRSKLITEGKWSTSGILFDVASDKIRPTSYGVLKEIAGVLSENPTVKVKIIGHTDNDGEEAANLDLSKRRAAAVKAALSSEFGIDADRMQTDGLGESKPVADNSKPEGKAQNRRVEFIKL